MQPYALSLSQTMAGLCTCHLSHLLLPVLLSSQVVPIGLWPCAADPGDFALGHEEQPGAHLGFSSLSKNGNMLLVKFGIPGPEACATPGVGGHQSHQGCLLLLWGPLGLWLVV